MMKLQNNSSVALDQNHCYSQSHIDNEVAKSGSIYADESIANDSEPRRHKDYDTRSRGLLSEWNRLIITIDRLEKFNGLTSRYNELMNFVSIGAHEIRAPLMPILGISELMKSELEAIDKEETSLSKNQIETNIRNTQKLAKISSEILDVIKIKGRLLHSRKTDVDLNELIIKTANDFRRVASKKNVRINYQ